MGDRAGLRTDYYADYNHSEDKICAAAGAIGLAILELADSMDHVARALDRLGTADAATHQGALEIVSGSLERIADAITEKE